MTKDLVAYPLELVPSSSNLIHKEKLRMKELC